MAITTQLKAIGANQNNASFSQSVTLSAGFSRMFLVAIAVRRASTTLLPLVPTVTYGGNALALVTDRLGRPASQRFFAGAGNAQALYWFVLREANLPANGAQTLSVTWAATTHEYSVAWYIMNGAAQDPLIEEWIQARNFSTAARSTGFAGVRTESASDAVLVAAMITTAVPGAFDIFANGSFLPDDFDQFMALTTGSRFLLASAVPIGQPFAYAAQVSMGVTWAVSSGGNLFSALRIRAANGFGQTSMVDSSEGSATMVLS